MKGSAQLVGITRARTIDVSLHALAIAACSAPETAMGPSIPVGSGRRYPGQRIQSNQIVGHRYRVAPSGLAANTVS